MSNKYFDFFNRTSEQNFFEELIVEALEIYGHDVVYLPRTLQKQDLIYNEDVLSKFDDYYDITVYVKTFDKFTGANDFMSKLGYDLQDQATLTVARSKFASAVGQELKRPREGDLIYFPLSGGIFEIKFVAHESVFYQLGELYVYDLQVEQFVYSHEDIQTGIPEIDESVEKVGVNFIFDLGVGSGIYQELEAIYQGTSLLAATAKAQVISHVGTTLEIRNVFGEFETGVDIVGEISGATYQLSTFDDMDIQHLSNADNKPIQVQADEVLDTDEENPFAGEES